MTFGMFKKGHQHTHSSPPVLETANGFLVTMDRENQSKATRAFLERKSKSTLNVLSPSPKACSDPENKTSDAKLNQGSNKMMDVQSVIAKEFMQRASKVQGKPPLLSPSKSSSQLSSDGVSKARRAPDTVVSQTVEGDFAQKRGSESESKHSRTLSKSSSKSLFSKDVNSSNSFVETEEGVVVVMAKDSQSAVTKEFIQRASKAHKCAPQTPSSSQPVVPETTPVLSVESSSFVETEEGIHIVMAKDAQSAVTREFLQRASKVQGKAPLQSPSLSRLGTRDIPGVSARPSSPVPSYHKIAGFVPPKQPTCGNRSLPEKPLDG